MIGWQGAGLMPPGFLDRHPASFFLDDLLMDLREAPHVAAVPEG